MPQNSRNSQRVETPSSKLVTQTNTSTSAQQSSAANGGETEEEKIAAMFQFSKSQWDAQQQEMAQYVRLPLGMNSAYAISLDHCAAVVLTAYVGRATPVHRGAPGKGKNSNVPDHPPPPGYVCYRCGEKGTLAFYRVAEHSC